MVCDFTVRKIGNVFALLLMERAKDKNGMADARNNFFYLGVVLDCFLSSSPLTPSHLQFIGKWCPFCLKIQLQSSLCLHLISTSLA